MFLSIDKFMTDDEWRAEQAENEFRKATYEQDY